MLNVFEPCTLQLGDRNYYKVRDNDVLLTKDQWRQLEWETLYNQKPLQNSLNPEKCKEITTDKLTKEKSIGNFLDFVSYEENLLLYHKRKGLCIFFR